jgi:hypothetical protein
MSDYATCVTEPFWESQKPDAYAYFAADDWTKIVGDRGIVSFSKVYSDLSYAGIQAMLDGALRELNDAVGPELNLSLCVISDIGEVANFSLSETRADVIAGMEKARRLEEKARAIHERIQRDMAADNGVPNSELDRFLG